MIIKYNTLEQFDFFSEKDSIEEEQQRKLKKYGWRQSKRRESLEAIRKQLQINKN